MKRPILHTAVALALAAMAAHAGKEIASSKSPMVEPVDDGLPPSMITLGGQFGDGLSTGYLDSLTPFWAPGEATFFLNTRSSFDTDDQSVSSIGLGARYLLPDQQIIFGGNVFYDSISGRDGSDFSQLGLGVEVLSRWVDARLNYYLPEDDQYRIRTRRTRESSSSTGNPFIEGGSIRQSTVTTTTNRQFSQFEAALEGWNAEVGFLVPGLDRYMETRIFGGYFHYDNPFGSDFEGFKARLEARFLPGVIGDLEYWEDEHVVGSNWFGGVRISVPFSIFNLASGRNPFEGAAENFKPRARDFRERQAEMIIRSHRVKTVSSNDILTKENTSTRTETRTIGVAPGAPAGGAPAPAPAPLPGVPFPFPGVPFPFPAVPFPAVPFPFPAVPFL